MSSSRVHTSFTGLSAPIALATDAASPATSPSGVPRRPKLPPASNVCTRTLSAGRPTMRATTWLINRGDLRPRPELAAVGADLDDGVERLHRRVRQVRELVDGLDNGPAAAQRVG